MEAKRYRKRPVEVEAMRWDGTADNAVPVVQWIQDNGANCTYSATPSLALVTTVATTS